VRPFCSKTFGESWTIRADPTAGRQRFKNAFLHGDQLGSDHPGKREYEQRPNKDFISVWEVAHRNRDHENRMAGGRSIEFTLP
jgi:hypothetical protein